MNELSVGILHYGEEEVLQETLLYTKEFTDSAIVARIDLFNHDYGDIILPWNFLLEEGYSAAWNTLMDKSPKEYMYILGAGKKIDRIDNFEGDYDTYATYETLRFDRGDGNDQYKVGRVSNTRWHGKIHEQIDYNGLKIQKNPTFFWSRFIGNEVRETEIDIISKVYRWFSRIKWLYEIQFLGNHRVGTNHGWWILKDHIIDYDTVQLYLKHKHIIEGDREYFLKHAIETSKDLKLINC